MTTTLKSPLLVQAVEDLLAGAAHTAPLSGSFVPSSQLGAPAEQVTAACAVGALQVGYALRVGQRHRWYDDPGLTAETNALYDAYWRRFGSGVIEDNDRWGRDTVVARCAELVQGLTPDAPALGGAA